MKNFAILSLTIIALALASCSKDESFFPADQSLEARGLAGDEDPCGTPTVTTLLAGQFIDAGTVTVYNSEENLYVTYTTANGWVLGYTQLFVGYYQDIPLTQNGSPQIGLFPYKTEHDPFVTEFTYVIPLSEISTCVFVTAHAEVHLTDGNGNVQQSETGWAEGDKFPGDSWAMYFGYCEQSCLPPNPAPCDEQLRTQTQGGWGAPANGQNPGRFLHDHFAEAFPNGLVIGCGNTVTFSSAQAITNYLPTGGQAAAITESYTDPGNNLKNGLVAQLTALSISIGFDAYYPDFGASSLNLADMIISSGDFEGMTVGEVVGIAHQVLGGCTTDYTPEQLSSVLDQINNNYVDGQIDMGFLFCSPSYEGPNLLDPNAPISAP
jgi:hypothetical protein